MKYTPELDAEMTRLFLEGVSYREIARRLRVTSANAVRMRLDRIGVLTGRPYRRPPDWTPKSRPARVDRTCMCCGKAFVAEGRFNRLCPPCGSDGQPIYEVRM